MHTDVMLYQFSAKFAGTIHAGTGKDIWVSESSLGYSKENMYQSEDVCYPAYTGSWYTMFRHKIFQTKSFEWLWLTSLHSMCCVGYLNDVFHKKILFFFLKL